MAFDKNLPDGDISIALGDDAIRANNEGLEDALTLEHDFSTGGTQTGRHKFPVTDTAGIILLTGMVEGSLGVDTDPRTYGSLVFYDGSAWRYLEPGDLEYQRTDEAGTWEKPQISPWVQVVPSAGNVAIDMTASPTKYVTATTDITILNPTGSVTDHCQNMILQVTMSGGPWTISWGSSYRASFGVAPIYDDTGGAVNVFFLTHLKTGGVLVSGLPDVGTF